MKADIKNTIVENKLQMAFAAIDKNLLIDTPKPIEKETSGHHYIVWGEENQYPEFLRDLFYNVNTLKTIIEGTSEFIAGDDATCNIKGFDFEMNKKGDTMRDILYLTARDYLIYGGFALQVIRNKFGVVSEIYYIDFRFLRCSKKNDLFWYSEEYGKKYVRNNKVIVYPKFIPEGTEPASIFYFKNEKNRTYPLPRWSGAIRAAQIEEAIDTYHLSALDNGFGGSYIINFTNGIPNDEEKDEIERNVTEKFAGASNAGRILLNFANSKDNAVTVEKLDVTDFSEKYKAAATRAREQMFIAFQAVPALFGLMSESTGFSQEEFEQAFRLYNRTVVRAAQRKITDAFDKIFQTKGSIEITPFSVEDGQKEQTVE